MSKQRNITELVGRVVEMKDDNKRYLVMPLEFRGDYFKSKIGTIKGRLSSNDLIYKDTVVIMPLDNIPEKRKQLGVNCVEGKDFIVRNARPEDMERIAILNNSMRLVLTNIKELYRNLTELQELERRQNELASKIDKLKKSNSSFLYKWDRPAEKSYLLELYKDEVETLNAKKKLADPNRPLYKTSLTGKSNATRTEVVELLKATNKPIYYRYGFAFRGAQAIPLTREQGIDAWLNGRNGGFIDMDEFKDEIVINEYSSNDMW